MNSYGDPNLPDDDDAAAAGSARPVLSAAEVADARRQLSRAIMRAGIVNAVVLAVAVLQYVIAPFGDEAAVWILVVAACLCALNMSWTVMRHQRRGARADGGVRGPTSYADLAGPGGPAPAPSSSVSSAGSPAVAGSRFAPAAPATPGELALEIEDVFSITGRGTVVTGTIATGTVRVGEQVRVLRAGQEVARGAVSGVEMFRRTVQEANAGEMVGLLIAGVSRDQVARGDLVTF